MTTFITRFPLPAGASIKEIREAFIAVAPEFQNLRGLNSKTFLLSEDGKTGGGVYVWNSREDAVAFEPHLRKMIRERMGMDAEISYFETPVVVDNLRNEIRRCE